LSLARHYTDYSPERLKEIYEKAGVGFLPRIKFYKVIEAFLELLLPLKIKC